MRGPLTRSLAGGLAALAAAACAVPGPAARPAPASAAPRAATPAPKASAAALATPKPAASFAPVPSVLVRGRVRLDAAYMVAAGGGNLSGTGVTATGLIGNDGSTLIGNDGSTLIGNDGSTLVGNDGGSLVAAGGLNFGLLQAAQALPFGAERPAGRMRVRIYELASGRAVLAARDPAAQRGAYVYTDADGTFEAPVRADAAANLLIYADVAGTRDPRLQYTDLLAAGQRPQDAGTIDEHRSMTAYYIRLAVRERLRGYFATDIEVLNGPVKGDGLAADSANKALLESLTRKLYAIGKDVRLDLEPPEVQDRVIQALQDLLLSNVDLDIPVYTGWIEDPYPYPADQRAFDAMDTALAALITGAAGKMNGAQAGYFTNEAAARRGFQPYYADVRKPADLGRVFIERYVAPIEGGIYDAVPALFDDVGADPQERVRFRAGADAFVVAMLLPLALDQPASADPDGPGMFARMEAILRAKGQGLASRAIPTP